MTYRIMAAGGKRVLWEGESEDAFYKELDRLWVAAYAKLDSKGQA